MYVIIHKSRLGISINIVESIGVYWQGVQNSDHPIVLTKNAN